MENNGSTVFSLGRDSPLRSDHNGNLRILIVGNSGAGKSTMASKLADILHFPVRYLDHLHWQPNWNETPDDQFINQVQTFICENDNWIIDGDYNRILGDLTYDMATCIVWLDPPFMLYFPRLILRTFVRLVRLSPPCSPGCPERLSEIFTFSDNSILWWCWTNHSPKKAFYSHCMRQQPQGGKWIRLGGWGGQVKTWLKSVESLVKAQ